MTVSGVGRASSLGPTANTRNALARVLRYTSYCFAMVSFDVPRAQRAGAFACPSSIVCLVDDERYDEVVEGLLRRSTVNAGETAGERPCRGLTTRYVGNS